MAMAMVAQTLAMAVELMVVVVDTMAAVSELMVMVVEEMAEEAMAAHTSVLRNPYNLSHARTTLASPTDPAQIQCHHPRKCRSE